MDFRKVTTSIIVLGAASSAALASDTLTLQQLTYGGSTDTANITSTGGTENVFAGPFNVSLNGGSTFQVFCADITDNAQFGTPTPVVVQDTSTLGASFQKAAQLYNAFAPTTGTDLLKNAGLQVAIWETLFSGDTYTDGTAGVVAQASYYLAQDVSGYSDKATYYNYGGHNQSQIGAYATPEPASFAAMGLGIGLLGLARRRSIRR